MSLVGVTMVTVGSFMTFSEEDITARTIHILLHAQFSSKKKKKKKIERYFFPVEHHKNANQYTGTDAS